MELKKKSEFVWEISKEGNMRVPGIVFASEKIIENIKKDKTIEQIKNVASLPGIVEKSIAMPDAHQGYGFPIGGVAAFDIKDGIISPGGVGYDINCGVRLLSSNISKDIFMKKRLEILNEIFKDIPVGVGSSNNFRFSLKEIDDILESGSRWCLSKNYAIGDDIEHTEDKGCIKGADHKAISQKAKLRGKNQLGTLGSGNHFLEIQFVEKIFNFDYAKTFGLENNQIVIMIHSGSRGLGHQTASDYIQAMEKKYGFSHLPDRELAYAPINSELGEKYQKAMAAAANFAFVNRQLITHQTRKIFNKYFKDCLINVVYDVAHNIAKFEQFKIKNKKITLCVHRKGATRSFGPGRKEIPIKYRKTGQPIIIPGSMGTHSYILVGTNAALDISFASTAHGAGRILSRSYANKNISPSDVQKNLNSKNILIMAGSKKGIIEEAPEVYKDIDEIARISDYLGIGKLVARTQPIAVIKG